MKRTVNFTRKASILLLSGIIIISVGLLVISCGKGPQQKVLDFAAGAFAVDFSVCTGSPPCTLSLDSSSSSLDPFKNDSSKKIGGKELTIEAWVKNRATSTLSGGIFGRLDSGGIMLYAKNNVLKALVRRALPTTGSVEYTVGDTSSVPSGWTHVAAVLVNENHASTTSHTGLSSECTSAKGETPHLDLYINGTLVNCASTATSGVSYYATEPGGSTVIAGAIGDAGSIGQTSLDGVGVTTQFEGIIDEARLWGVARTPAQIRACMNRELSVGDSQCGIDDSLISYFRFNEGSGVIVSEFSGLGAGGLESAGGVEWTAGWTTDTPF